jgi:predicted ABC-type ATPase
MAPFIKTNDIHKYWRVGTVSTMLTNSKSNEKANFAFETTLASRTFAMWIPQLQKQGYQFHLIFLWLQNADLAVFRVNERVRTGGHSVPEATIRRLYIF